MGVVKEDVETAYKRILSLQDVVGLLLVDKNGNILRSTMTEDHARQYAAEIPALVIMARSAAREIDADDDLNMLRLKSRKHEMMVAVDDNFTLIVLQEYPGFWIEPPPPPPPTPPRDPNDSSYETSTDSDESD